MIHIGARGFDTIGGEVVSTTAYILSGEKGATGVKGQYVRLVDGQSEEEKSKALSVAISNHDCGYYFEVSADQFEKIPGSPIAYWVSDAFKKIFIYEPLSNVMNLCAGLATGDNNRFEREWFEVASPNIFFICQSELESKNDSRKWYPCNSGGNYRKWYGNFSCIVNWQYNGEEIKSFKDSSGKLKSRPQNTSFYFKEGATWTKLSSGNFAIRYSPKGHIFDDTGRTGFVSYEKREDLTHFIGLLCSKLTDYILSILNPTLSFTSGDLGKIPVAPIFTNNSIDKFVDGNIEISKSDWDSFETSWDFSIHPLLDKKIIETEGFAFEDDEKLREYLGEDEYDRIFHFGIDGSRKAWSPIEFAYLRYKDWANKAFFHLKKNEEELNKIFIDIYDLQDELTPEEDDSMVSVHRIFDSKSGISESMRKGQYALTKEDVVKSFISYVVGCMFGRYDADRPGLAYAGGDFDISSYSGFIPDSDNVIPVLGDSWFKNDAETYFIKFVEKQFGHDTLNENLKFIENALGKSIRDYFYKDFYKDHLKTYQKRPIYWMFSSPKGYFQALVYMHRYNENTANVVLDYLRQFRDKIRLQIKLAEDAGETKKKVEYENIDKDLNDYEMNILYPLAIQHLTFDLDDGVKVNYQKLGKALKPIK